MPRVAHGRGDAALWARRPRADAVPVLAQYRAAPTPGDYAMSEHDRDALRYAAAYAIARWQHGGRLRRAIVLLVWPRLARSLAAALEAAHRDGHR